MKLLHERGARVIERLVAFRDPVLAEWAWTRPPRARRPDTLGKRLFRWLRRLRTTTTTTSRRNVDLAVAAAKLGVDDVLYDYLRRPDSPLESMVVPGLEGDPADAVVQFLVRARQRLIRYDTFLGASVFGIAATRPAEIAQDVPAMAREVDYVAPMLYPSHWGPQEYGVADPEREPYAIVRRSLLDFRRAVRGSGARRALAPGLLARSPVRRPRRACADRRYASRRRRRVPALGSAGHVRGWSADAERAAADDRLPRDGAGVAAARAAAVVRSPDDPVRSGLAPNEFGVVPVLMYHRLLPDGGGDYDLTPAEFRAELARLP